MKKFHIDYFNKVDKIFLVLFLLFSLVVTLSIYTLSLDYLPSNGKLMFIKHGVEKVILATKKDPNQKAIYMNSLLDERLTELEGIVVSKNYPLFLSASLKYSSLAGDITNLVVQYNLTNQVVNVQKKFADHEKKIYILLETNKNDNHDNWKFIQDATNYLHIYSQRLRTLEKSK